MTREDIIRMAREAGASFETAESMFRFTALVAAAEREAAQRAFLEACRPHGKVGEVVYTTYKHINARGTP